MTAFHSSPRMLGQKQDKFWLTVGLCALTAALIFLPFYLLDGGFFHYAGDFNSQQISFYRYMNGFLKGAGYPAGYGGVKNTFSWATDLGSGTMNAYSFYLYGSPFFWFSLLFPQNWLPLPHGAAAGAQVRGGGRRRVSVPAPLRQRPELCGAGRGPLRLFGLGAVQHLLQPLHRCAGPLPLDALGTG